MKRKSLPKKLRFEVLKRDRFTCVYCGRSSPAVLLHVDHINPVANGGKNDLLNLVTACFDCNSGKGATLLSDESALKASTEQRKMLAARREQLKMLMEWQEGLANIETDGLRFFEQKWREGHGQNFSLNETGRGLVQKTIREFGLAEAIEALRIGQAKMSADQQIQSLFGICRNRKMDIEDPVGRYAGRACNILRKRFRVPEGLYRAIRAKLLEYDDVDWAGGQICGFAAAAQHISDFEERMGSL